MNETEQKLGRTEAVSASLVALMGLSGWLLLLLGWLGHLPNLKVVEFNATFFAALTLSIASRFLAVRIFRRVRIALDSTFYIATAFTLGVLSAASMAACIVSLDGLFRFFWGSGQVAGQDKPSLLAPQFLSHGGLPTLLLLVFGLVLGIDTPGMSEMPSVLWSLPLFGVLFLTVHYLLAGGTYWLTDNSNREVWRLFFWPVVLAEAALVPLSLAMALAYQYQGVLLFILVGANGLLFNELFRRIVLAADRMGNRLEELATLNRVSRIISGSLERQRLLGNIARETLALVRHTSRFMIGTVNHDGTTIYELFDETGTAYKTIAAPKDDGLSGWVFENRKPLLLTNVQRSYAEYSKTTKFNDPRFNSWAGVPLVIYDEVIGVMSVQSQQKRAFNDAHLRVLEAIADQATVALENARLYEMATVDGLTGLHVRRYFEQRMDEEWERSTRYGTPFALGIFDLDDFKAINDTYGHQFGDQVLRMASAVVTDNMRGTDLAGRYGGEEFIFMLPRTNLSEARTVAERIRSDVEALVVEHQGRRINLSASIGVSAQPESGSKTIQELVEAADDAMYLAKRSGKNQVFAARRVAPDEPGPVIIDEEAI